MKEYARVLTQNNLLNYDTYTKTFKTTEKGLIFETYNQMDDRIKQLKKNTKKSRRRRDMKSVILKDPNNLSIIFNKSVIKIIVSCITFHHNAI
jgi:hypothetical protein